MALRLFTKPLYPNCYKISQYLKSTCAEKPKQDLVNKELEDEKKEAIERLRKCKICYEGPSTLYILSGVPEEHTKPRTAKIFKPAKNALQSGTANTHHWQVIFDCRSRWENPLMGWCSTGDPLYKKKLRFCSKEDAIKFCEDNGWEWFVQENFLKKKFKVKSYRDNFVNKRCRLGTK